MMPGTHKPKILVIRNDKLGDFVLSLPVFALLKRNLPDCELHALVPEYTSEIADQCPWIDQLVIDPGQDAGLRAQYNLLKNIRHAGYDAVITLFSTTRVGLLTFLAGVPVRFAPATKIAQIFYNHRITQRRSRSAKPEFEYNLDLACAYLTRQGIQEPAIPGPPYLIYPDDEIRRLEADFHARYGIESDKQLVFVHPGSGGSANNLSTAQYAELIRHLATNPDLHFVLSAGPGEQQCANEVAQRIQDIPHTVYISDQGLNDFAKHIAFASLFIAGSTGPLHIAGALNIPTAGFYTLRRSATPLRWQTLNTADRRLALTPDPENDKTDMSNIDLATAATQIGGMLRKFQQR